METVEIVVYLSVAVLIGGLILTTTAQITSQDLLSKVKALFNDEKTDFQQLTNETLPGFLFSVWKECGLGSRNHTVLFTYKGDNISESDIFAEVKRLRLCNSFSNTLYACGTRIDTVIPSPIAAGIHEAQCNTVLEQLIIS